LHTHGYIAVSIAFRLQRQMLAPGIEWLSFRSMISVDIGVYRYQSKQTHTIRFR
jgi:hypothetical protein